MLVANGKSKREGAMLRIIATAMGLGLMLSDAQAVEIKLLASNALRTVLQDVQ